MSSALLSRDEIVRGLVAAGVPRPSAERAAELELQTRLLRENYVRLGDPPDVPVTVTTASTEPLANPYPTGRSPDPALQTSAVGHRLQLDAAIPEKAEQRAVYQLFRAAGLTVWNLSQARASKQSAGLPDAFVTHPDRPIAFWFETKRQVGGKLAPAQRRFRADCQRAGVPHHVGDRYTAARLLKDLGLAEVR